MANILICLHVYKDVEQDPCEFCGKPSHRMDWKKENERMKQWKKDNPNAPTEGWMSI